MPTHIEIHIDKIVLRDFDRIDPRAIQRALQVHLAELLVREGLSFETGGEVYIDRVRAADIRISSPAKPTDIGKGIARVIAREVQPGKHSEKAPGRKPSST